MFISITCMWSEAACCLDIEHSLAASFNQRTYNVCNACNTCNSLLNECSSFTNLWPLLSFQHLLSKIQPSPPNYSWRFSPLGRLTFCPFHAQSYLGVNILVNEGCFQHSGFIKEELHKNVHIWTQNMSIIMSEPGHRFLISVHEFFSQKCCHYSLTWSVFSPLWPVVYVG